MPDEAQKPAVPLPFSGAKGNQFGSVFTPTSGHLFSCQYLFFKHDPAPLVLIAKVTATGLIAGLNLHYLTFPYVKMLINTYCGTNSFNYQAIKSDQYIVNAYRSYKRAGMRLVRGIDCQFLKTILQSLRSLNPEEIEEMRKSVNQQLKEQMNQSARTLANKSKTFAEMMTPHESAAEQPTTESVKPIPTQNASIPPV